LAIVSCTTRPQITTLLPLVLIAFLLVRARRPRGARDLAIFLTVPGCAIMELGLRSAIEYGADGHSGIALRAAEVALALVLVATFSIEALLRPGARTVHLFLRAGIAVLAGLLVAIVLQGVVARVDRAPWDPAAPPDWAIELYRDRLPALGEA